MINNSSVLAHMNFVMEEATRKAEKKIFFDVVRSFESRLITLEEQIAKLVAAFNETKTPSVPQERRPPIMTLATGEKIDPSVRK